MSYYGRILELKTKHPELVLYKSAIRKSDGKKFKIGDKIQHIGDKPDEDGDMSYDTIIAFDHYNHPQFGKVKRAITSGFVTDFYFNCLHDVDFVKTIFKREILIEKTIKRKKKKQHTCLN